MSISSGSGVAVPEAAGVDRDRVGAGLTALRLAGSTHAGRIEGDGVRGTGDGVRVQSRSITAAAGDGAENNVPGTSFSISLRVLGGPPCNADICCRRLAPLFAARRSRRSRALVCVGVSPGTAPGEEAAADESAMMQVWWCGCGCGCGRGGSAMNCHFLEG